MEMNLTSRGSPARNQLSSANEHGLQAGSPDPQHVRKWFALGGSRGEDPMAGLQRSEAKGEARAMGGRGEKHPM